MSILDLLTNFSQNKHVHSYIKIYYYFKFQISTCCVLPRNTFVISAWTINKYINPNGLYDFEHSRNRTMINIKYFFFFFAWQAIWLSAKSICCSSKRPKFDHQHFFHGPFVCSYLSKQSNTSGFCKYLHSCPYTYMKMQKFENNKDKSFNSLSICTPI